jgi:hypothetical protein
VTRFRIAALFRPDALTARAWDWSRIREQLTRHCGEVAASWALTAQQVLHPTTGAAHVLVRAAPEGSNLEAWGELYTSAEALAQALSEALETQVAVFAFEVEDGHGLYARWERGQALESEARVADPLSRAAHAMDAHEATVRQLVVLDDGGDVSTAEAELDAEDFAELQWLEAKRREAREWMERYRLAKQVRAGDSDGTK